MFFKDWLNEVMVGDQRFKGAYYVNPQGQLVKGYPEGSFVPYVELTPAAHEILARNLDPTSKLFKDIIQALRRKFPDIDGWTVNTMSLAHSQTGKIGWRGNDPPHQHNAPRQVKYWTSLPRTSFENQMPKYLYHGTSTELWYEGIKSNGLLPRRLNKAGAAGSYGTSKDAISNENHIFLAVHPDAAARNAAFQAAREHGGEPLILRISTHGLDRHRFRLDQDMDRTYAQVSAAREKQGLRPPDPVKLSSTFMGAIAYEGKIPPSLIEPLMLGKREDGGRFNYNSWRRFEDVSRPEHPLTIKLNQAFASEYNSISSHDSPYFYALREKGIVVPSKDSYHQYVVARKVTDAEIRKLIKESPWARDALQIDRDLHDWGMDGIKGLGYLPAKVPNDLHQKVIDLLVHSKVYGIERHKDKSYLRWESPYGSDSAIAIAKGIHQMKMTYRELEQIIKDLEQYREKNV